MWWAHHNMRMTFHLKKIYICIFFAVLVKIQCFPTCLAPINMKFAMQVHYGLRYLKFILLVPYLLYFWHYGQKLIFSQRLPARKMPIWPKIPLTNWPINMNFDRLVYWGGVGAYVYFQVPTCQIFAHMAKNPFLVWC